MGLVLLLALPFAIAKKLAQKSKEPSSADAGLYIITAMSFGPLQSEHAISYNTSYRYYQSHSKVYDWHADSSHRSTVKLSRERITPRISSRTSLKYCIHFGFILKLMIFIYKQLKRPVAFSAVQPRWQTEMARNHSLIKGSDRWTILPVIQSDSQWRFPSFRCELSRQTVSVTGRNQSHAFL